ncbi:hypothetical protein ACFX1W_019057 [Malus domestica]
MSTTPPPLSPTASVSTTTAFAHGLSLLLVPSPKFRILLFRRKLRPLLNGLEEAGTIGFGVCEYELDMSGLKTKLKLGLFLQRIYESPLPIYRY